MMCPDVWQTLFKKLGTRICGRFLITSREMNATARSTVTRFTVVGHTGSSEYNHPALKSCYTPSDGARILATVRQTPGELVGILGIFNRIERLELDLSVESVPVLFALTALPVLSYLRCFQKLLHSQPGPSTKPIVLASLCTLVALGGSGWFRLPQYLVMPRLVSLELATGPPNYPMGVHCPDTIFDDCLTRFSTITTLGTVKLDDVQRLLCLYPRIQHLNLWTPPHMTEASNFFDTIPSHYCLTFEIAEFCWNEKCRARVEPILRQCSVSYLRLEFSEHLTDQEAATLFQLIGKANVRQLDLISTRPLVINPTLRIELPGIRYLVTSGVAVSPNLHIPNLVKKW